MGDTTGFRIAVITLSDSCHEGRREDLSGAELARLASAMGRVLSHEVLPDGLDHLPKRLIEICDGNLADVVFTTGGTGFTDRDLTPEATKSVIEREVPGISEYLRMKGAEKTPNAILSRGVCGLRKRTLIVNLPGSVKAVREGMELIVPVLSHALEKLAGDHTPCGG